MAAVKKPLKDEKSGVSKRRVEIDFSGPPKEFLFFNSHQVERTGGFVTMLLGFIDQTGPSLPVFRGVIWHHDLSTQVHDLEKYIEKIGAPNSDATNVRRPVMNFPTPPVPFNHIGCASRGNWGEISIRQFSHKAAIDLNHPSAESNSVAGVISGVYVSDIENHKSLIYDLITCLGPS